ncbi:hypothetical protein [Noviherbaspirillum pedocola]|uniref:Uncharacterized protein n=1 Tax=Noviherbaspirillum pedocola TaxID=2801341 RepID=A0A934W024_9BURK|nr:hypothetical protein [Noviherbaspirillum pedocola]MBK4733631.1 hypothetical protein [Noviherbaspirillum pedocola]
MKRRLDDRTSPVRTLPYVSTGTLTDLPHDVMPNIWLRLPEETMAALLCTSKRFHSDQRLFTARALERKIALTARPTFLGNGTHSPDIEAVQALLNDTNLDSIGLARCLELFIDAQAFSCPSDAFYETCFSALEKLDRYARGRALEKIFQYWILEQYRLLGNNFAPFLLKIIGEREDWELGLAEEFELAFMSEQSRATIKIWLFFVISCKNDEFCKNSAKASTALIDFMKNVEEGEMIHALSWIPCLHNRNVLTKNNAGSAAQPEVALIMAYYEYCDRIDPVLSAKVHSASLELLQLHNGDHIFQDPSQYWRSNQTVRQTTCEALVRTLLQLDDEASIDLLQYPLHRIRHTFGGHDFYKLQIMHVCEKTMKSACRSRAGLGAQLMLIDVLSSFPCHAASNNIRIFHSVEPFWRNLPATALTADALAMFSCMTAYMKNTELQSNMFDWLIKYLQTNPYSGNIRLVCLLAYLSAFLDHEKKFTLQLFLQNIVESMSGAHRDKLTSSLKGANFLANKFAEWNVEMSAFYSTLWRDHDLSTGHEDWDVCKRKERELILSENCHEEFIASFFLQLNAIRTWPELQKNYVFEPFSFFGDNDSPENSTTITSDSAQQELRKLETVLSPAAQLQYLKILLNSGHHGHGIQFLALAVLKYRELPPLSSVAQFSPTPVWLHGHAQMPSVFHIKSILEIFRKNKSDLPLIIEAGRGVTFANNKHIVSFLPFWHKLLKEYSSADRYRLLTMIASSHYFITGTPTSGDLAFTQVMSKLARYLRDGDKPDYLNRLAQRIDITISESGVHLFAPIKAVAASIPPEFGSRLQLQAIAICVHVQKLASLIRDRTNRGEKLHPLEKVGRIIAAPRDRRLSFSDIKMIFKWISHLENGSDISLKLACTSLSTEKWELVLSAYQASPDWEAALVAEYEQRPERLLVLIECIPDGRLALNTLLHGPLIESDAVEFFQEEGNAW